MKNFNHKPQIILPQDAKSLDGLFRKRVAQTPDSIAYRQYDNTLGKWIDTSWQQMDAMVTRWRAALIMENLASGDRVAIMMKNCREWVVFEQAALSLGLVIVPLYPNDRPDNVSYIINDAGAKLLLIEDKQQWHDINEALKTCPSLIKTVVIEPVADNDNDVCLISVSLWLPNHGVGYIHENQTDDLATIVYTSGTTGHPKGVMLSHKNILWNAWSGMQSIAVYPDDLFLSFLPLSHTFERTIGYYIPMMAGATVAYARSIPKLGEDLLLIHPTILVAVPRIFERVYTKISNTLKQKPAMARKLFDLAVKSGWQNFQHQQRRSHWKPIQLLNPLLKKIVADKIINKLGGRLRFAISGGAALPTNIAKIFVGLGLNLVQGYGLTETSPVIGVNQIDDNDPASVGLPLTDVDIKITKDTHELLIKSPGVMLGYWNNPQATAEIIDNRGWLHTGDKAAFHHGHIYITGRLKDILVMANGEKVPPTDMEAALNSDGLIDQSLVLGEGRPYLSAILVVNPEVWKDYVKKFAKRKNIEAALHDHSIEDAVLKRIAPRLHDFPVYANIRKIFLTMHDWNIKNGLMTPTLKIKRDQIMKYYAKDIRHLYDGH